MEYAALWMIQKMPRDYCFVLVVHNSTSVRSTDSFMLSDTWNPMGISWDTLKLVRKHYKKSVQVANQGSTNIFVIVWLLEASHTHVKHWWWKNYRWVVAKLEISGNNNCSLFFQEKRVLRLDVFHKRKRKMQQNYVLSLSHMQVRNVTAIIVCIRNSVVLIKWKIDYLLEVCLQCCCLGQYKPK